ncbi:UDP-glucose iridoid glucosyltransferase-like [Malania oleifera]|uniref:UDP-glucose iridoid glucosyltransferase-like n=1 Tax=Malania oleifera TaxID=397392 RepID=UPI0025AEA1D9|nr:UDP-glucose iridoid glucosyltransferase-like [Malania oleifera]
MEESGGQGRRRRVVLVPFPAQGHINPMLHLGTMLHSRGFSITLAHTLYNFPCPSSHPHFRFLPFSDGLSGRHLSSGDLLSLISALNANCVPSLRDSLAQCQPSDENEIVACIIYDGLMHFSETVADQLNIPSAMLRTSSVAAAVAYEALPRLHREGFLPIQDSLLQDSVPELHPLRFKDLPFSNSWKIESSLKLVANIGNPKTSSAIIYNTMDFLEQPLLSPHQQKSQVPIFTIGPFHRMAPTFSCSLLKEDDSCMKWLDKQAEHSVLYISFGSMTSMEEKELTQMASGLANSQQPFLWVVRPGSVRESAWIEPLSESLRKRVEERGCIVKWAPQKEVLAHLAVGGFWSHCGWNSTLESVCEGVPMICRPCTGDQKVNARYLSHVWKMGVELKMGNELAEGEIERAVRRVMVEEEGKEIRQRAMELKKKAEICVREGGSSFRSLSQLTGLISSL